AETSAVDHRMAIVQARNDTCLDHFVERIAEATVTTAGLGDRALHRERDIVGAEVRLQRRRNRTRPAPMSRWVFRVIHVEERLPVLVRVGVTGELGPLDGMNR